jgi:hypothetical protein
MGIGVAKGEKRISDAVRCAVASPLLNTTIEGASSVILNIIGGKDLSLDEVIMAADLVKGVIDYSANVIFGACIDESMRDEVEVVIIATGFNNNQNGITPEAQENAFRQATLLSQRIDQTASFGQNAQGGYVNTAQNPAQRYEYAQQPVRPIGQTVAQPTQEPAQTPVEQLASPAPNTAFDPEDPIPEPVETEDKKHRPRFVDFFMKRNSEDK